MTGAGTAREPSPFRRRSFARRLAMQALYQWQMTQQPAAEICAQFVDSDEAARADLVYFRDLVLAIPEQAAALGDTYAPCLDRPENQLDPIERAVLLIGTYELLHRKEIPFRVVIDEAVALTRRFGAEDGYRFVNAVLDCAARAHRAGEE